MISPKALSLLAAVLMTSACVASYSPSDSPKQVSVRIASDSYVVKLNKRGKALPAGEKEGFDDYLSHLGDLRNVEFTLRRTHRDVAMKALAPVEKELVVRGADPKRVIGLAEVGTEYQGKLSDVEVIAKRYVVVTPSCPDQSVPEDPLANQNLTASNFGCATATALALQIADPRDLARGRDVGAANGAHSAGAVNRYETDQVKSIDEQPQSVTMTGLK
ncbi:MAG TPA: CpaD family pilus assembly lipoprotein [Alphaproteobacteria bacterium]|nr:CpaD family pilus assembly lipoprotein [Alphaproteobacteria bacterium]